MSTFAFVENGGMVLANLNGRTARPFARIEDPVLLTMEAAAELAQAIINIRQKYSEPVNGHEEPIPAIAQPKPALPKDKPPASSEEVYEWLLAKGPQTKDAIQRHFKFPRKQILHNRIYYLQRTLQTVFLNDAGLFEAIPYDDEEPAKVVATPRVEHEEALAFIRENPGQPARVIKERVGMTHTHWHTFADYIRRNKLAHVKPDGGYYPGVGEQLTPEQRSAIARMQYARNYGPSISEPISEESTNGEP